MPMFYFDILETNGHRVEDVVGVELEDAARAKSEARKSLAEMTRDAVEEGEVSRIEIRVRDAAGADVEILTARIDGSTGSA